jgi:hypothetical protein
MYYAGFPGVLSLRDRKLKTSGRILIFLIEVFQPLFWIIRFVFRIVNPVLFSWWATPLFERWDQNGFAEDIRQAIPSLFDVYGGRVVRDPNPRMNSSSMGYVCIGCPTLIFKFHRWRRESYGIEVAPAFAPGELFELADVLDVLDPTTNTELALTNESWYHWGRLLESRFPLLEQAFRAECFQETKERLANRYRK